MPNNKLAFLRYLLIDSMLRDKQKPYPSVQEILDACEDKFGVRSVSTIEKDFAGMRLDFDAPIKYSKLNRGYYYEDPSYKMMSVNLSEDQLTALEFVEGFLEEFKAFPIFNEFSNAIDRVIDGLEITRNFNQQHRSINQFIQIDKSPYVKGKEALSGLIKVISEGVAAVITYRKFGAEDTKDYLIHPYFLKEFDNLWYLVGFVSDYQEIRTFAVDRIEEFFREPKVAYISPERAGFSGQKFFANCYGITVLDGTPERIELSFAPYQGNYLKARPIHTSMEVLVDNEEEFRIALLLVSNFEIKNWIMSFGAKVKVVKPAHLRNEIAEEWKRAASNYAPAHNAPAAD